MGSLFLCVQKLQKNRILSHNLEKKHILSKSIGLLTHRTMYNKKQMNRSLFQEDPFVLNRLLFLQYQNYSASLKSYKF
jgi:hypothetical protein